MTIVKEGQLWLYRDGFDEQQLLHIIDVTTDKEGWRWCSYIVHSKSHPSLKQVLQPVSLSKKLDELHARLLSEVR